MLDRVKSTKKEPLRVGEEGTTLKIVKEQQNVSLCICALFAHLILKHPLSNVLCANKRLINIIPPEVTFVTKFLTCFGLRD